eukprot:7681-Heterococcus_DN1.PRE.5
MPSWAILNKSRLAYMHPMMEDHSLAHQMSWCSSSQSMLRSGWRHLCTRENNNMIRFTNMCATTGTARRQALDYLLHEKQANSIAQS